MWCVFWVFFFLVSFNFHRIRRWRRSVFNFTELCYTISSFPIAQRTQPFRTTEERRNSYQQESGLIFSSTSLGAYSIRIDKECEEIIKEDENKKTSSFIFSGVRICAWTHTKLFDRLVNSAAYDDCMAVWMKCERQKMKELLEIIIIKQNTQRLLRLQQRVRESLPFSSKVSFGARAFRSRRISFRFGWFLRDFYSSKIIITVSCVNEVSKLFEPKKNRGKYPGEKYCFDVTIDENKINSEKCLPRWGIEAKTSAAPFIFSFRFLRLSAEWIQEKIE